MFERFTDRARHVVKLAQEEAIEGHSGCIATEHLWVALLREGAGLPARLLAEFGVDEDELRRWAVETCPSVEPPPERIPFTPNAKRSLEYALREALRFNHNYIGTEHIMLALCRLRIMHQEHATGPLPNAKRMRDVLIARMESLKSIKQQRNAAAVRAALRPLVAPNNLEAAVQTVMDLP